MREIKFRAFDKKDNEMFYSSMYQDKTSMAYGLGNFLRECGDIEDTLMQYTGFKDKNEVEIYEGDILIIELDWGYGLSKIYTEVYFGNGMFKTKAINSHEDIPLIELPYLEVIGNIYENKELLNTDG